jgi:hypothetical protein
MGDMMNWNQSRQLTFLSAIAVVIFGFQNCSPVEFEQFASQDMNKTACLASAGDDCVDPNAPPTPPIPDTIPERVEIPENRGNNDSEAIATCEEAMAHADEAVTLAHNSRIHKQRGNVFAKVSMLRHVHKSKADLMVFIPGASNAYIHKIMHHRGDILLCGVNVGKIMHFRGKITAVNLNIGKVKHFRGDLNLENGVIGTNKHIVGSINVQ